MVRFLHPIDSFTFRRKPKWYLACSWILGLGCGGLLFRYAGDSAATLMPLAASGQLSIVSLFLSALLPFLIAAFAVFLSEPRVLLLICFCKAVLYGYVVCAVFSGFGQQGWLIRLLLLFTDTGSVILLCFYALEHISGLRTFSPGCLLGCIACIVLLVGLDSCYISPFLRLLLS